MLFIDKQFCRKYLPVAFEKAGPERIEYGTETPDFDYVYVQLHTGSERYNVTGLTDDMNGIICARWNGVALEKPEEKSFNNFDGKDLLFLHFYGEDRLHFTGIREFAQAQATRAPYRALQRTKRATNKQQVKFNAKKIETAKRMELLQLILKRSLAGFHEFTAVDLLNQRYGNLWMNHPDRDAEQKRLDFYLAGLVATGDVQANPNFTFTLTGTGLRLIEDTEEQERKFQQGQRLQKWVIGLTIVIAALTFFQAGLIKMDPWYDGSKKEEKELMVKPPPKTS